MGTARKYDRQSKLDSIEMINIGPVPGIPDPVGFVRRFGDEVMPKVSGIG